MFTVVLKEDSHKEKLPNYFCFSSSSSYISIYQYYTYSYEGLNKIEKKSSYEVILGKRDSKRKERYEVFLLIFVQKFGLSIRVSITFETTTHCLSISLLKIKLTAIRRLNSGLENSD